MLKCTRACVRTQNVRRIKNNWCTYSFIIWNFVRTIFAQWHFHIFREKIQTHLWVYKKSNICLFDATVWTNEMKQNVMQRLTCSNRLSVTRTVPSFGERCFWSVFGYWRSFVVVVDYHGRYRNCEAYVQEENQNYCGFFLNARP